MIAFAKPDNIIAMPTKSNEWYTPARYIEAAREVMGGIDLDPASCKEANMVVRAEKFYTKEDNGLMYPWYGRVWLNPPYSDTQSTSGITGNRKGYMQSFLKKVTQEYQQGQINQAIILVTTDTDARWFQLLWEYPLCFVDHKVIFHRPGRSNEGQFFGTCFVYLGPHEQKFIDTFSKFGTIAKRVSTPRQQVTPLSLWEVSP